MTTRTTIAAAVSRYLRLPEEADDCADEVIMALERAGLVVAPREPTINMLAAAAPIASKRPSAASMTRAAAAIESMRGPMTQDALIGIAQMADDYHAMINAAKDPTHGA